MKLEYQNGEEGLVAALQVRAATLCPGILQRSKEGCQAAVISGD